MTRVFRRWTPADLDAVVEITRQHPKKDVKAIARLGADQLGRTFAAVQGQVISNPCRMVQRRKSAVAPEWEPA